MKCALVLLFLFVIGGTWRLGRATCVLESDFGFVINCAFKNSGLFRVRNLGGVKAHASLGFSLGDELGFKESISNTEVNRRRSAQASKFAAQAVLAQQQQTQTSVRSANANVYETKLAGTASSVPPFKPIPPAAEHPRIINANATRRYPSNELGMGHVRKVAANANRKIGSITNAQLNEIAGFPVNMNHLQKLLANANISESTLEAVLRNKIMATTTSTTTTTTTTTTTKRPTRNTNIVNIGKVMNAPKEYYPVGYDKNFDDNFSSRVELPETSFYCGDQKHFPGLYADEDLGCMVFHVCALTDDGLIMKSFLCPESTLFDQTILKCNWWFYVDCKNSRKLYDSNIPISKSYQLMKALTFFSSYKKDAQDATRSKD